MATLARFAAARSGEVDVVRRWQVIALVVIAVIAALWIAASFANLSIGGGG